MILSLKNLIFLFFLNLSFNKKISILNKYFKIILFKYFEI
jgi:hypothetical protein